MSYDDDVRVAGQPSVDELQARRTARRGDAPVVVTDNDMAALEAAQLETVGAGDLEDDQGMLRVKRHGHPEGTTFLFDADTIEARLEALRNDPVLTTMVKKARLVLATQVGPVQVRTSVIRVFLSQPRTDFDEEELVELSLSMSDAGLGQLDPIKLLVLEDDPDGFEYQLVDGERRFLASQIAGLETLSAMTYRYDGDDLVEVLRFISTVANMCRAEHTVMEKSGILHDFVINRGMRVETAAEMIGITAPWARKLLALQRLPVEIHPYISDKRGRKGGTIGVLAAQHLVDLPADFVIETVGQAVELGWSEQDIRRYVGERTGELGIERSYQGIGRPRRPSDSVQPVRTALKAIERELSKVEKELASGAKAALQRQGRVEVAGMVSRMRVVRLDVYERLLACMKDLDPDVKI